MWFTEYFLSEIKEAGKHWNAKGSAENKQTGIQTKPRIIKQEFYIQQRYSSTYKWNKDIPKWKMTENLLLADTPYNKC